MPPFSANFTEAKLGVDASGTSTLFVAGTSQEPEKVEQIFVAVPQAGTLLSVDVGRRGFLTDWQAQIPAADTLFQAGQELLVVGVATLSESSDPFLWHNTLTIEPKAG